MVRWGYETLFANYFTVVYMMTWIKELIIIIHLNSIGYTPVKNMEAEIIRQSKPLKEAIIQTLVNIVEH